MKVKTQISVYYGLGIFALSSFATLIIIFFMTDQEARWGKLFWILWSSSLLPTVIASFVSAFLYHYLIESKKKWVHAVCFILNAALIIALAPLVAFLVLNAMVA